MNKVELLGVQDEKVYVEVSNAKLASLGIDPALIAGIELEAAHAVVHNSFRSDLIRLKSELVHHDTNLS